MLVSIDGMGIDIYKASTTLQQTTLSYFSCADLEP